MSSINSLSEIGIARRTLLVGLMLACVPGTASAADAPSGSRKWRPTVLFVCQFGTAKSAVAREVFRRRAAERGIDAIAFSRGITPEQHVSPALRQQLVADGLETTRDGLHKLETSDLAVADIVVVFSPLPKGMWVAHVRDWSALPSMNDAYPLARADLRRRVDALLDTIAQRRDR